MSEFYNRGTVPSSGTVFFGEGEEGKSSIEEVMHSGVTGTGSGTDPDANLETLKVGGGGIGPQGRDVYDLWNSTTELVQTCINGSVTTTTAPIPEAPEDTFTEIFWKIKLAGAALLVLFCFVSVICNVCVLAAARWIKRRPLSTIMRISLSLTAADSISSLLLGIGLLFNTLIVYIKDPAGVDAAVAAGGATLSINQLTCNAIPSLPPTPPPQSANHYGCFNLVLEAVRLGAILVTMLHLLFLAAVHYLGTLRPLCRLVHFHGTFVFVGLVVLWVCPPAIMLVAFAWYPNDGFRSPTCSFNFLTRRQFHLSFSLAFFLVLVAMVAIYIHIYIVVHRTQRARQLFQRTGSAYHKPAGQYRTVNGAPNRQSIRGGHLEEATYNVDFQRHSLRTKRSKRSVNAPPASAGGSPQRSKNRKAIITTLCILGSYLVGWMPAVVSYMLICKDCFVPYQSLNPFVLFAIFWLVNFLVILKTMCNAFIYTARMKDIKEARQSMCQALRRHCCQLLFRTTAAKSSKLSMSESSHQRLSLYTRTSVPVREANATRLRGPVITEPMQCRTDV